MSKKIKSILISALILLIITGCDSAKIPSYYLRSPKEAINGITGSWVEVTMIPTPGKAKSLGLSGELIAAQSDTLYILSDIKLSAISKNNIETACLYIFKNQGGKYALFTGLLLAPNIIGAVASGGEYAGGFLAMGIPMSITGIIITIMEGSSKSNRLIYPSRNSIEEFRKFARFPMGIPPELDKNELRLMTKK